jgi:flagellin
VDVAQESSTLARNQILQQASSSMLAQANQSPQIALNLLR